jgi:hypothetical protein
MTPPCLAIIRFTCFAAWRAQKHKALAHAYSSLGLVYAKARESPRPVMADSRGLCLLCTRQDSNLQPSDP